MLDSAQEQQIRQRTDSLIQQAAALYRHPLKTVEVRFDLKGRNLGMYVIRGRQRYIRYNPYIFARHFEACVAQTIPHEVAHYVCDRLYGLQNIKPHGKEWKAVIQALGAEPRVTSAMDISGLPVRRYRQFDYRCACQQHRLSSIRHNKVQRGRASYRCRRCGENLLFVGAAHEG